MKRRERQKVILFARELKLNGLKNVEIQIEVNKKWGVNYCYKTILCILNEAFREERIKRYEEENKIVERWHHKELEEEQEDITNSAYAERLFEVFTND